MPIETSMYGQTPTTRLDPAGAMSSAISNANGMLQNKLLQAQVPLQINNEQIANAAKQLQMVSDHVTPLLGMGDKVTAQDVQTAALQAAQNSGGAITPDKVQQFVQQITSNPSGIPAALQQFHQRTLQGLAQAQAIAGQQGTVSNGLGVQYNRTNTYTGAVTPSGGSGANVQVYPSRSEMGAGATVGYDRSGAPIVGTNQQRLQTQGGAGLLAPAFRGPQGGSGSASPTAAPAAAPGPVTQPLESATKSLQDDFANSSSKMQGVQPLLQAIPLIDKLGASGAGPGSATENQLKSFLVTHGVLNANDTNVDVRNEANKYLKKYVAASGASGAGGSDYRTAFTSESNPNLDTDQKATLSLAKAAVAFDRMEAARPLGFDGSVNEYGKHKATWSQSQDPRAYGLDLMDPAKRASLVQEMAKKKDTPEGQKFFRSLKIAHDNQMLTGPTNAGQ